MRIDAHTHTAPQFSAPLLATNHDRGPIPFARYLHKLNLESPSINRASLPIAPAANMDKDIASKSAHHQALRLVKPINSTPPARFERVYIPVHVPITGRLIDTLM